MHIRYRGGLSETFANCMYNPNPGEKDLSLLTPLLFGPISSFVFLPTYSSHSLTTITARSDREQHPQLPLLPQLTQPPQLYHSHITAGRQAGR